MALPIRLYVDGVERTANLDPASVTISRQLNKRQNEAELAVYRLPLGGYYENPSSLVGVQGWWHLDDTSGNLVDSSGNGRTLNTLTGSPLYQRPSLAPGYGGKAVRFDSSTIYQLGTASDLQLSVFTIGLWVDPVQLYSAQGWIGRMTASRGYAVDLAQDVVRVTIRNSGGGSSTTDGSVPIRDGRPHFIAVSLSAGRELSIYVDGELDTQTTIAAAPNHDAGQNFRLGRGDPAYVNTMQGRFDEVFISNQVLSSTVIADLYAQGREGIEHVHLSERSEIVLLNEDSSIPRFGGYAVEVYRIREGAFDVGWQVRAVGWENNLETIAIENYTAVNKRTDEIIAELFANDTRLTGYSTARVARGKTIPGVYRIRDRYMRDVMDELAKIDADEWWIDTDGIHVWKRRANYVKTAAVRFSNEMSDVDQSTVWSYRDLKYTRNFRNPANRILFRGSSRYVDWNPRVFGTGSQYGTNNAYRIDGRHLQPLEGDPEIVVQINTGTRATPVWSADLEFGRYGRDTLLQDGGDKEVLLQVLPGSSDRLWFDITKAPPNHSDNAFRLYARDSFPVRIELVNQEAYIRLGNRYYDRIVYDEKVTSIEQARQIATDILSRESRVLETLEFVTDLDPDDADTRIEVGDLVHFRNSRHGIQTYEDGIRGYRVQKIETRLYGAGLHSFSKLTLGTHLPKNIDLLKLLEARVFAADDFDDDEEENVELLSGWEGTDQDINDSVAIVDVAVIT